MFQFVPLLEWSINKMSTLQEKYYRQLKREYDWNGIVSDAKQNAYQNDGEWYGSCYLGSLINPSGKYYLPFACSNVDSCKQCGGTGLLKSTYDCEVCQGLGYRFLWQYAQLRNETLYESRQFLEKTYPDIKFHYDEFLDVWSFDCLYCHGTGKRNKTCNHCGGLGSHEAYQDQEWQAALDRVAEEFGGFIESGEGDPCDIFFVMSVDPPEDESEEDNFPE